MARKSYAKATYSTRLDGDVLKELQRRAKEEQTTVPRAGDGGTVPVIDDEGATVGAFGRRTSASRRSACNP